MRFEIIMKPSGMSRTKRGMPRPELLLSLIADDTAEAARLAREQASAEGFNGYAITKIKEYKQ